MALFGEFTTLILFTVMAAFVECQITTANSTVACLGDNVDLDWVYGNTADVVSVTWAYIDSQTLVPTTIMQFAGGSVTVSGNYNVVHKTNGGITLTEVKKSNSGSYKITVIYAIAPQADDTVTVTVNDCSTTTTRTSTTLTTTPASKTTTPASTTRTPASTTTTTPSTTTPTITTISTLRTTTTPVTTPSTTSLSDEMIIVIVVLPVGVIAIVGTVIFFCLFYRLRRGKRKPAGHKRHKQRKHYKGNMRSVQQQQQQPYILYGRGHTEEPTHKETKRSQSLHNDDIYNGYHWGNQVKQNPVYKGDRNLARLYYNESLPRYDYYWSGYTTGHVYPSQTSGYQYRRDYHGDSRPHGNHQHSSYPVYSRQQEYINPSHSYMGY